jgi:hypothetical protein
MFVTVETDGKVHLALRGADGSELIAEAPGASLQRA